jgi:hypothetical protein
LVRQYQQDRFGWAHQRVGKTPNVLHPLAAHRQLTAHVICRIVNNEESLSDQPKDLNIGPINPRSPLRVSKNVIAPNLSLLQSRASSLIGLLLLLGRRLFRQ